MKKLAIAIAVLAAAVVSTGSLTPQAVQAPSIQADFPIPPCTPNCAINIPS
jgi:hypothetical protein